MTPETGELWLVVRAGVQLCALPLEHIEETMRPQPVQSVAGVPPFVRGVAVLRGRPVPVVDAALTIGHVAALSPNGSRFVSLKTGERHVALVVDEVVGVLRITERHLADLPPLLAGASRPIVSAIGTLDSELFMVLGAGKLVPEATWAALERASR